MVHAEGGFTVSSHAHDIKQSNFVDITYVSVHRAAGISAPNKQLTINTVLHSLSKGRIHSIWRVVCYSKSDMTCSFPGALSFQCQVFLLHTSLVCCSLHLLIVMGFTSLFGLRSLASRNTALARQAVIAWPIGAIRAARYLLGGRLCLCG